MPRSSALNRAKLVDGIVGVADRVRGLATDLGARQWQVFVVTRTWDGGAVGDGDFVDEEEELDPRPIVAPARANGLTNRLEPCGLVEAGVVKVSEVSLAYSWADLTGEGRLAAGQELLFVIRDGEGQGIPDRYFVHDRPPHPDREDTIGWHLSLRRQQGA